MRHGKGRWCGGVGGEEHGGNGGGQLYRRGHWALTMRLLQNGNYPDPSLTSALPLKRQFRDPYADW